MRGRIDKSDLCAIYRNRLHFTVTREIDSAGKRGSPAKVGGIILKYYLCVLKNRQGGQKVG